MGLSPLAGVPMGTRAGDIDTCVAQFIMNKYNMTADECLTMLNKKSGVLALSERRVLRLPRSRGRRRQGQRGCQLALDKFCLRGPQVYRRLCRRARRRGLPRLHRRRRRERLHEPRAICDGLEYLGVKLDPEKNKVRGEEVVISAADSSVKVWVIPTNEELMIAQDTAALCGK